MEIKDLYYTSHSTESMQTFFKYLTGILKITRANSDKQED